MIRGKLVSMRWALVVLVLGVHLVGCSDEGGTTSNERDASASGGAAGWAATTCNPGEKADVGPCDKCGVLRRSCDASGHFDEPVCEDQRECAAGETNTRSCGNCGTGTQSATCSSQCTWVWGTCSGGGKCAPDAVDNCCIGSECGCRICRDDCTWAGCKVPCPY